MTRLCHVCQVVCQPGYLDSVARWQGDYYCAECERTLNREVICNLQPAAMLCAGRDGRIPIMNLSDLFEVRERA
jgi:hypothetical protein